MLGSSYWSYNCKIDWSVYKNIKIKDYKESGVWKLGRELVVFLHIYWTRKLSIKYNLIYLTLSNMEKSY